MTIFRTLEGENIETITAVFNAAFSDYIVPFKMTCEQLQKKFESENIALNYSVGAFDGDQFVGFILHFYGERNLRKVVYNGGTGVIKAFRGNGLTARMYEFIFPRLKIDNIQEVSLEVLSPNIQAIKSYTKSGFHTVRELLCFKGEVSEFQVNKSLSYKNVTHYNWDELTEFWDVLPTWQNSILTVQKLCTSNISLVAYLEEKLVGYIIFNPEAKRIQQLAVNKRYRCIGVGKGLVAQIIKDYGVQLTVINVDSSSLEMINFLENIGLKNYINQLELRCDL